MKKPLQLLLLLFSLVTLSCKKEIEPQSDFSVDKKNINKLGSMNLHDTTVPVNNHYVVDSIGKPVQFFKSTYTTKTWQNRMKVVSRASHSFPTGLYLKPNTTLTYTIELISGTEIPSILIGTYSRTSTDPRKYTNSSAGTKNITDALGGIIWVEYDGPNANSECKITFQSGYSSFPVFIKNKTTQAEWQAQLDSSDNDIVDVMMLGNRTVMVYSKNLHPNIATQNNNSILNNADFTMDFEDDLAGFDNLTYEHSKCPAPHLIVHDPEYQKFMGATTYRTKYSTKSGAPIIFAEHPTINWGLWHELGHMHQQSTTTYFESIKGAGDGISETTVNIFSLAIEKALGITPNAVQRENLWPSAIAFLNNPSPTKNFDKLSDWGKLPMFHQLSLAYGNDFYRRYHRSAREDSNTYSTKDDIKRNIIKKACQASGYDLSNFFIKWTFLPANDPIFTEISNLNLPKPIVEPHLLTDTYNPTLENGAIYQIQTALNTNKVLDVNSNSPANNTLVSLWSKHNPAANNQKFLARAQNDGSYVFKSVADTTKVLSTLNGLITNGTQLAVHDYDGSNNQKWTPQKITDHLYKIKSHAGSNSYIDVAGGTTANGTKIIIYGSNNGNNQRFRLVKQ